MNFPANWQNCPPDDASPAAGIYFRVGRGTIPVEDDFRSQAELGKALDGDECLRQGLSTLREYADAVHLRRVNPRLGSIIYKGELNSSYGKSKLTSSRKSPSHTTLWAYIGINKASFFAVCKG